MEHPTPPSRFSNPVSAAGIVIAVVGLVAALFLIAVELTASEPSAYAGIITFVLLPIIIWIGILTALLGARRESARRARGLAPSSDILVLDFSSPRTRKMASIVALTVVAFLGLSMFGSFKAYEYTESNSFCGEVCHTVMQPEHLAAQDSPHAQVHCADCHVGSGAEWFIKSKINGTHQLWALLTNSYAKPVATPVHNLRPAADTCGDCHWAEKEVGDRFARRDYYLSDDQNTHSSLELLMHVGGGGENGRDPSGIHWHASSDHRVEFLASDERRQEIPWIRVTWSDGRQVVYTDKDADFDASTIDENSLRTMDCTDCHNRPAHQYNNPARALNIEMARGAVDASIPGIKSTAVDLLEADYASTAEAQTAIAAGLTGLFESEVPDRLQSDRDALDQTLGTVQALYARNYFPQMKTDWTSHPDNLGHLNFPGCMRCHNASHVSESGESLARDCQDCHRIRPINVGTEDIALADDATGFRHPEDIGEAWREMPCTDCHAP